MSTNNLYARQRWAETHSSRMKILTDFYEVLAITKYDDMSNSNYQSRKFIQNSHKLTTFIEQGINPFDENLNSNNLFNLSTGKSASEATANFLLTSIESGMSQAEKFIDECIEDPSRFYRPIKRNQIINFSHKPPINKTSRSTFRTKEIQMERDIVAQILCIVIEKWVDLGYFFSFPLTAVPHSLSSCDGTPHSNSNKTDVLIILEENAARVSDQLLFDIEIVEGFYFLKNLGEAPTKYGKLAEHFLKKICNTSA